MTTRSLYPSAQSLNQSLQKAGKVICPTSSSALPVGQGRQVKLSTDCNTLKPCVTLEANLRLRTTFLPLNSLTAAPCTLTIESPPWGCSLVRLKAVACRAKDRGFKSHHPRL